MISVLNSWGFGERACQPPSENYHSVAVSVHLGQTRAYITSCHLSQHFSRVRHCPGYCVSDRWAGPHLRESQRKTRTQLKNTQSSQSSQGFTGACLHSAMSWLLGLLAGRTGRPCQAGRPGGDTWLVLPCILPHCPKHSPHQFSAV